MALEKKSEVVTIVDDFERIPKLSELSEDNKRLALSFLEGINSDNYESILKYSEGLKNTVNLDLDLLKEKVSKIKDSLVGIRTVDDYKSTEIPRIHERDFKHLMYMIDPKQIKKRKKQGWSLFWDGMLPPLEWDYLKTYGRDDYNRTLNHVYELREQMSVLIEEIQNTELLAELKLIAFNEFIKGEITKEFSDPIKGVQYKRSLIEEKTRLIALIQIIRSNLFIAVSGYQLGEYEKVIADIENYIEFSEKPKGPGYVSLIHPRYEKYTYYHQFQRLKDNISYLESGCDSVIYRAEEIKDAKGPIIDTDFVSKTKEGIKKPEYNSEEYKRVMRIIAENRIALEKYTYSRKRGHIQILDEINAFVNSYRQIPFYNWNAEELDASISALTTKAQDHLEVCKQLMEDEDVIKLREAVYDLNFLKYVLDGKRANVLYTEERPSLLFYSHHEPFYFRDEVKKDELLYYEGKVSELLDAVESKYEVSLGSPGKKRSIIDNLYKKGRLGSLFNFLNHPFDARTFIKKLNNILAPEITVPYAPKGGLGYNYNKGVDKLQRVLKALDLYV